MKQKLRNFFTNGLIGIILLMVMIMSMQLTNVVFALVPGANHTMLAGGGSAVLNTTVNNFVPMIGVATPVIATSEGTVASIMGMVGHLHDLNCQTATIAGVLTAAGGTSVQFIVRQNETSPATGLTCTELTAATSCSDKTHDMLVAVGDQIDIEDIPVGTPTANIVDCSVELDL